MQSGFISRHIQSDENLSSVLSKSLGIDRIFASLLIQRGHDTPEKAKKFLHCGTENLCDPFLLSGMSDAAEMINAAISQKKSITIYGDYDADGICSVAILYLYFLSRGAEVSWYIPEREEGYGINKDAVDYIEKNFKPSLFISVDCGITAAQEVEYIKSKGIDVIITDHHNVLDSLPDAVLVNPKLSPDYPCRDLCGAGVALKLVHALGGKAEAEKYIDIAAIATVADSVELTGENRDIVSEGLKRLNSNCRKGIKFLYESAGLKDGFNTYAVAFGIVPRINAAGRIGEAKRALMLFYENDETALKELAAQLNAANAERQQICEQILASAKKQVSDLRMHYLHAIAVIDETCHTGVSGIVASKLCEEYYRPSFVFCEVDGVLKGSGRSVEGVNIFDMLTSMPELFERFGGHAYAAGLSIKKEKFEEFKRRADAYFSQKLSAASFTKKQYYDYDLTGNKIDGNFMKQLKMFEPCGVGNSRPKFMCRVNNLKAQPLANYPKHLSFKLFNTDFIAFNFGSYIDILNSDTENQLLFEFQQNIYNGREYNKGFLKDFSYGHDSPSLEGKINSNLLLQLNCESNPLPEIELYSLEELPKLIEREYKTFGTLIIASTREELDSILKACPQLENLRLSVFSGRDSGNVSRIVLAPDNTFTAEGYETVIFAGVPLSSGYIAKFKTPSNKVYIPSEGSPKINFADEYSLGREIFGEYYKMITDLQVIDKPFVNIGNLYYNISMRNKGTSLVQFTVCYMVFLQLGFIAIDRESDRLIVNKGTKRELDSSEIYRKLAYFQQNK